MHGMPSCLGEILQRMPQPGYKQHTTCRHSARAPRVVGVLCAISPPTPLPLAEACATIVSARPLDEEGGRALVLRGRLWLNGWRRRGDARGAGLVAAMLLPTWAAVDVAQCACIVF